MFSYDFWWQFWHEEWSPIILFYLINVCVLYFRTIKLRSLQSYNDSIFSSGWYYALFDQQMSEKKTLKSVSSIIYVYIRKLKQANYEWSNNMYLLCSPSDPINIRAWLGLDRWFILRQNTLPKNSNGYELLIAAIHICIQCVNAARVYIGFRLRTFVEPKLDHSAASTIILYMH